MKTIDKFVLVPFERYERLTKEHTEDKNIINTEKQVGKGQEKVEKVEGKAKTQTKKVTEISKGKIKKQKKLYSNIKQIPTLPPGIPDKPKIADFKWLSLY